MELLLYLDNDHVLLQIPACLKALLHRGMAFRPIDIVPRIQDPNEIANFFPLLHSDPPNWLATFGYLVDKGQYDRVRRLLAVPVFTRMLSNHSKEFVALVVKHRNLCDVLLPDMAQMSFFDDVVNYEHAQYGTLLRQTLLRQSTVAVKALLSRPDLNLNLIDWGQLLHQLSRHDYILDLLKLEGENAIEMASRIYDAARVGV